MMCNYLWSSMCFGFPQIAMLFVHFDLFIDLGFPADFMVQTHAQKFVFIYSFYIIDTHLNFCFHIGYFHIFHICYPYSSLPSLTKPLLYNTTRIF